MPSGSRASGSWPFASQRISLATLFYLSLAFSSSILAQDVQLRPSEASDSFPSCGLNCNILTQADDACTPPSAQVTNRQTYVSCFCQSSLLTTWSQNIDSICTDSCQSSQDRQTLQTWYTNFCQSGGQTTEDSTDDNNSNNNNNNDDDNSNADSDSEAGSSSSSAANSNSAPQSWWDGHWKWVVMVIVLAAGFTIIGVVGMWLKRRHDRRHPNLYHAGSPGASGSRVFQDPNRESIVPALAPRGRSVNAVSFASSTRTDFVPPSRQGPSSSPLQRAQVAVQTGEAPRQ
ncbi:hypothetical protein BDV06DRAFT_177594 [Aspergillus oleicola]